VCSSDLTSRKHRQSQLGRLFDVKRSPTVMTAPSGTGIESGSGVRTASEFRLTNRSVS